MMWLEHLVLRFTKPESDLLDSIFTLVLMPYFIMTVIYKSSTIWSCSVSSHPSIPKKDLFSLFQAVGKQRSPTPSRQQGWRTLSQQHAARATWASVAATGRSRGITIRRKAGSGEAARLTSNTALSSPDASWMPARLKRLHAAWWTCITMRQAER